MTKEKEIECDCKMFIGGSGKLCPECSKQNYAFYSEARKQGQNSQKKKDLEMIRGYIEYRGGMGNRIDAYAILDLLTGKNEAVEELIEKHIKQKIKGEK